MGSPTKRPPLRKKLLLPKRERFVGIGPGQLLDFQEDMSQ